MQFQKVFSYSPPVLCLAITWLARQSRSSTRHPCGWCVSGSRISTKRIAQGCWFPDWWVVHRACVSYSLIWHHSACLGSAPETFASFWTETYFSLFSPCFQLWFPSSLFPSVFSLFHLNCSLLRASSQTQELKVTIPVADNLTLSQVPKSPTVI